MPKKVITFTDQTVGMIEKIKEKTGALTNSEVVRTAIFIYSSKIFKDYLDARPKTAEDIANRKQGIEDNRERMKEDRKQKALADIVKSLDGKLITKKDGTEVCVWTVHQLQSDFKQELPVSHLTTDLARYQWVPDKETVEKFRIKNKNK